MPDESLNSQRKLDHIRLSLDESVQFKDVSTGFAAYHFIHEALPEIDLAEVDPSLVLFGRRLRAPLLVTSMTGGVEEARVINHNLALACQRLGLGMGVGSQRAGIERPDLAPTYQVRDVAPDILLFANLGAVQLNYGYGLRECRQAVDMIGADALILHLNPLQEAIQPEGNTNFAHLLDRIGEICAGLHVPVIVKEVSWGISETTARRLAAVGVKGLGVAGAGGTSWSEVERRRWKTPDMDDVASAFANWGIPTAESIRMARRGAPDLPIIASGGIRSGVDVAKAIALGATAAAIGQPLLRPALESADAVTLALTRRLTELRIAMFCVGARTFTDLQRAPIQRGW
jgi:isopentenyl-diphosphate delta-isomerase